MPRGKRVTGSSDAIILAGIIWYTRRGHCRAEVRADRVPGPACVERELDLTSSRAGHLPGGPATPRMKRAIEERSTGRVRSCTAAGSAECVIVLPAKQWKQAEHVNCVVEGLMHWISSAALAPLVWRVKP